MKIQEGLQLTKLLKHLVALIQGEVLDILCIQNFVSDEGIQPTRGCNNNMWTSVLLAQYLCIFLDRRSTIEGVNPNLWHILGESSVLIFDLKGKFPGMAEDDDRNFAIYRLQLL